MLDGTPLLDMKPCVPDLDDRANAATSWFTGRVRVHEVTADHRFGSEPPPTR